jgi:integrase
MLYTLAAWTGFRKGELGSLSRQSLDLDADPPTATVAACYSKHRRQDTQVLHPEVVRQLREWLKTKKCLPNRPLFPISGRVPGGMERKTYKMIQRDLETAREKWLEEAPTAKERAQRASSDFLTYCNAAGRYADFHSCRHLFITSLERAGVSPKMAQTLARHSDIRLTLGVYTHLELHDQTAAIASLPAPPEFNERNSDAGLRVAVGS